MKDRMLSGNVRFRSLAGAATLEIDATLLTVKLLG